MEELTKSIKVEEEVHQRLGNVGRKNETYNSIIKRAVKCLEAKK